LQADSVKRNIEGEVPLLKDLILEKIYIKSKWLNLFQSGNHQGRAENSARFERGSGIFLLTVDSGLIYTKWNLYS
jgi:hypothetical protein